MVPEFDRIYAVSDLHLGGTKGHRAFRETAALVKLIELVGADPAPNVALVLNGDIVDFLAGGPGALEFNPAADAMLRDLVGDVEYKPIFDALARLIHAKRPRTLVIQLGNHDIELALPGARRELAAALKAKPELIAERVIYETGGRGWVCKVGARWIQVVHGNHCDPWNMVDHAGLQAASDALARGAVPTPPKANAGTTMVCRVLNAIKVDFPFVDLLKPEDAPLMAVMAAIDMPTSYGGLTDALLARLPRKQWGELLGENADAEPPLAGPEREVDQFLSGAPIAANDGTEVLRRVEDWMDQDKVRRPRDLVPVEDERLRSLGDYGRVKLQRIRSAVARLRGTPNEVSLRHALVNWLARDESFDIGRLSAIDLRIVDAAPHGVDLVIAGHTHVPRHQQGVPEYINTGTWMRVLKLTGSEYLQSDAKFRQFFDVVGKKHALAQLDQLDIDPRARPVAVVDARQAGLYSVVVKGKAGSLQRLLRG